MQACLTAQRTGAPAHLTGGAPGRGVVAPLIVTRFSMPFSPNWLSPSCCPIVMRICIMWLEFGAKMRPPGGSGSSRAILQQWQQRAVEALTATQLQQARECTPCRAENVLHCLQSPAS